MRKEEYSTPLDLKNISITDAFWGREQELVRQEVIPYQWEALNDRVPGASPSYCMRNFRVAGRLMKDKKEQGKAFIAPTYTFRGFEALPEDPANPDPNKFYGFVFQDSDFAKWIEAVGHAVRGAYLYSGMADMARLTGDEEMYAACERLWNNITEEKLYITGGIGGTHVGEAFSFPYDLPNDTAYSETCAAIGLAFFARRMLQIQADSRYGDVMEQALYNTVLAGMSLDGKSFFYVNPLEVYPEACRKDEHKRHVTPVRQKWFGCACCPPNIARIVSSVGAYAYTKNEHTLYTHLYVGSSVRAELGDGTLEMTVESCFPWEGEVKTVIHKIPRCKAQASEESLADSAEKKESKNGFGSSSSPSSALAFRIPGWCRQAYVEVRRNRKTESGEDASFSLISCAMAHMEKEMQIVSLADRPEVNLRLEKGYLYLTADWQDEDEIHLTFPMEVRCIRANSKVQANIGKVAFTRGPVCYCMEEADNGKELWLLRADMRKLFPPSEAGLPVLDGVSVETSTELGHEMRILKVPGLRQVPSTEQETLYDDFRPAVEKEVSLTLIPYYAWSNRGEGEMSVWVRC